MLADCVLALVPPGADPKPEREERLNQLMREVGGIADSKHRRHMPAHWHALAETMLEARAAANDPEFTPPSREGVRFKKQFAVRLSLLRQVLRQTRKLFTHVGVRK